VKVAVYTIALNEAAHVERWANSAIDADYRIVADTGSTDNTVELLTRAGVSVHRIAIRPWRFDDARNAAMALIPDDVDVCCSMDMDRWLAPDWRAKLEANWAEETTAIYCRTVYRASVDDPTPLRSWPTKNFHRRWGYRFRRPVHEALFFTGDKEVAPGCDDIVMYEVQDLTKSTRQSYLPLMEVAHKEDPNDGQICFWLGRDLMWAEQHGRAIELLQRYLALPTSTWREERSEAMRFLARMQADQAITWLDKARVEAPHRRETWLDLAEQFHAKADWLNLFWACANGIELTRRTGSYLDDPACWGSILFDLGSIACWQLGALDRAVEWGRTATDLSPGSRRLADNLNHLIRWRESARTNTATVPADAPRTRVFTSSGTVLYIEKQSGQLRHGGLADSPTNTLALFVSDSSPFEGCWVGWLMHDTISGLQPITCTADGCWSLGGTDTAVPSATPTVLQLIPLEQGVVGIQSGGRYLCAEPDGRVSLSRPKCSLWEFFVPAEDWCAAPPPDVTPHVSSGTRYAIDWPGLQSFIAQSPVARRSDTHATSFNHS
jgi:hypothetical protein